MSYLTRPAQINDASALEDLLRDINLFAWINNAAQETHESIARHLSLCLSDNSHSIYIACNAVACNRDEPANVYGYVSVHWLPYLISKGPEGYVSELFIRPSSRGQGIGSALLETAIAEARQRGCARMRLLNMRNRESYLRGFYKKHGWEEREDAATFQLAI